MKTIRGKLLVYFFAFLILFQVIAISIFVSSNKLTNTYQSSFQRFLLLNSISEKADELYSFARAFVDQSEPDHVHGFYQLKDDLVNEKEKLLNTMFDDEKIELRNYINTLETFIHETELTVGFILLDDIEQYTHHLEETRRASQYIREATLELLDVELTAYQSIYNDLQKRNEYFFIFIIFLFLTTIILAIFLHYGFQKELQSRYNHCQMQRGKYRKEIYRESRYLSNRMMN